MSFVVELRDFGLLVTVVRVRGVPPRTLRKPAERMVFPSGVGPPATAYRSP